jgi:hypothetical protein
MAQRNIDFGSFPDDPNADAIRTAFQKVQENFSELFSGLQDQAVISVNRTAGTGITVNSPTGNVIVSANIAQVRIQSSTLDLSTGSNASPASLAVINTGTVPFFINLPQSVTGISDITLSGTLTAANANITSQLNGSSANFTGNITSLNTITSNSLVANTLSIASSANIVGLLSVTGNVNVSSSVNAVNVTATGNISASNANITSITSNSVTANFFFGDGTGISNVAAIANTRILNGTSYANISDVNGNLNIVIAGTPTMTVTATGANITGTLNATGNITGGNLIGRLANGGTSNITIVSATGNVTTAVDGTTRITATSTGANITGTLGVSSNANVLNLGTAQVLATANVTAPQLISNVATGTAPLVVTSTTQVANLNAATAGTATSATTAGTVTTNAQPNITSVGTLSSLSITGNVIAGNVYANSGTIGASLLTGTLTTAAQPNITSVGTLTGLGVNGNITAANITANTGVFTGNGSGLSALNASNLSTGTVSSDRLTGSYAISVTSATTAGTVTTNAQPNITSVGTLSTLSVTGNVSAGNVSGTLLTGTLATAAQPNITSVGTLGSLTVTNKVTAGQLQGDGGNISNIQGANVSGAVASATAATTAGTVTTNAQPNITSVGTLSSLAVTGNTVSGNVFANSGTIGASLLTGTLTTAAQPNITSVGTLSSLSVSGNLSSGNANLGNAASANFFIGDGSLLTNIAVGAGSFIENGTSNVSVDNDSNVRISVASVPNVLVVTSSGANITGTANVTGNLSAGNISTTSIAGNLTTAAQTNITSVGTLTGLTVNGTSNLGPNSNVRITGGVNNAFLKTDGTGNLIWDTATLVPAQGSNTQVIFNDSGSNYAGDANLTFNKTTGDLFIGGNLTVGNSSGSNNITSNFFTGTLRTNAQPNITSVGTLSSLNVNNTVTAVAFTANTGVFTGNGSGLTALNASNISTGTVSADRLTGTYNISITGSAASATTATSATTAGTVTTNAQPNITSVGTLSTLLVNGNVSAANITVSAGTITSNLFSGNGANLTNLTGSNVTGQVANALVAGTVYTAAQPNITSLGTLTSLGVSGNITAANITANTGVITGNGSGLTALNASNLSTGTVPSARLTGSYSISVTSATTAGTVTTAAQPNITSVGTLTSLGVSGNITAANITANTGVITGNGSGLTALNASNLSTGTVPSARLTGSYSISVTSATTAGTVTTAAQPNITSVGTLTGLGVNGTITGVNITANTGVFTGNGSALTALNASNISTGTLAQARLANSNVILGNTTLALGTTTTTVTGLSSVTSTTFVGSLTGAATTAGTVTTASQPNITSVGTLTSLNVSGNITSPNLIANTGFVIRSVNGAVSAAGTVQANATAITREINVVSTAAVGSGVRLPAAVAGMVVMITNTSANTLNVYPATGGSINSLSANSAYAHSAGATLQFIAPTTTQWYTVGATYA